MKKTPTLRKTLASGIAQSSAAITLFVRSGIDLREMVRGPLTLVCATFELWPGGIDPSASCHGIEQWDKAFLNFRSQK
jgi:hypothetical protein